MLRRVVGMGRDPAASPGDGQLVIVVARWLLILAGLVITLWRPAPGDLNKVRVDVFVVLALAVANFYLHARLLVRRRPPEGLLLAASAADIGVITVLASLYGGFRSPTFVFYFPAVIAFALAFPRPATILYALAAISLYALVCAPGVLNAADLQVLTERVLALVGVATVASTYLDVERTRLASRSTAEALSGVHDVTGA